MQEKDTNHNDTCEASQHQNHEKNGHVNTPANEEKKEDVDYRDALLRALADNENLRKRIEKEKIDIQKYAITALAKDIIAVYDNLERAFESTSKTNASIQDIQTGISMILKQLDDLFAKHRVSVIAPLGEVFNPHHHQAITEIDGPDEHEGKVVEVLQKGYSLEDRLLRPALVNVGKKTRN